MRKERASVYVIKKVVAVKSTKKKRVSKKCVDDLFCMNMIVLIKN